MIRSTYIEPLEFKLKTNSTGKRVLEYWRQRTWDLIGDVSLMSKLEIHFQKFLFKGDDGLLIRPLLNEMSALHLFFIAMHVASLEIED